MSFGVRPSSMRCLSRMKMLGMLARHRTSALDTVSTQDKADASQAGVESFLLFGICGPCLAVVISVLMTQALYTIILVFVAAFPISMSMEGLSVTAEPRYVNCSITYHVELIVIDGDGWQFHCIQALEVGLLDTDGQSALLCRGTLYRGARVRGSKFTTLPRKKLYIFITLHSAAAQQPARSIGFSCKVHYGFHVSDDSCRLHSLTSIWTTFERRDAEV